MNNQTTTRTFVMIMIAFFWGIVGAAAFGQETKPFILRPASPSSLQDALAAPTFNDSRKTYIYRSQMLEPIPAGQPVPHVKGQPQRSSQPSAQQSRTSPPTASRYPTYVYQNGRLVQVINGTGVPGQSQRSVNATVKSQPKRPKIDYSLAPVQPAVQPKFGPRVAPSIPDGSRIVDGAPLLNQEHMVAADRPQNRPHRPKQNSRFVRRSKPKSNCPDCANKQEALRVANLPADQK